MVLDRTANQTAIIDNAANIRDKRIELTFIIWFGCYLNMPLNITQLIASCRDEPVSRLHRGVLYETITPLRHAIPTKAILQ